MLEKEIEEDIALKEATKKELSPAKETSKEEEKVEETEDKKDENDNNNNNNNTEKEV